MLYVSKFPFNLEKLRIRPWWFAQFCWENVMYIFTSPCNVESPGVALDALVSLFGKTCCKYAHAPMVWKSSGSPWSVLLEQRAVRFHMPPQFGKALDSPWMCRSILLEKCAVHSYMLCSLERPWIRFKWFGRLLLENALYISTFSHSVEKPWMRSEWFGEFYWKNMLYISTCPTIRESPGFALGGLVSFVGKMCCTFPHAPTAWKSPGFAVGSLVNLVGKMCCTFSHAPLSGKALDAPWVVWSILLKNELYISTCPTVWTSPGRPGWFGQFCWENVLYISTSPHSLDRTWICRG